MSWVPLGASNFTGLREARPGRGCARAPRRASSAGRGRDRRRSQAGAARTAVESTRPAGQSRQTEDRSGRRCPRRGRRRRRERRRSGRRRGPVNGRDRQGLERDPTHLERLVALKANVGAVGTDRLTGIERLWILEHGGLALWHVHRRPARRRAQQCRRDGPSGSASRGSRRRPAPAASPRSQVDDDGL